MGFKNISPREAKELLDSKQDYVYIDVRSEFEFKQNHPANAYNLPVKQLNLSTKMLEDNPEFLEVFEANFAKAAKLIIGCAAGPRSTAVCQILEQRGYEDLANVDGGFGGIRDISGVVVKEGWLQLGFPVGSGDGGERSYAALKQNVK